MNSIVRNLTDSLSALQLSLDQLRAVQDKFRDTFEFGSGSIRVVTPVRPTAEAVDLSWVPDLWIAEGEGWLLRCPAEELACAWGAALDRNLGPVLWAYPKFGATLLSRLGRQNEVEVLNIAWFLPGGPPVAVVTEIEILLSDEHGALPLWWAKASSGGSEEVVDLLVIALLNTQDAAESTNSSRPDLRLAALRLAAALVEDLGFPNVVHGRHDILSGVASTYWSSPDRGGGLFAARLLLAFLDGDIEIFESGAGYVSRLPVTESIRVWVRLVVAFGNTDPAIQPELAELLNRRIGAVLSAESSERWRAFALDKELQAVRAWLLRKLIDIVFLHLIPEANAHHATQAEDRKAFWMGYSLAVERIWLLVSRQHWQRVLSDPAITSLSREGLIGLRRMRGETEKDVLWMHLRASDGEGVSVFEGNSNASLRVRRGRVEPDGGGDELDYHEIINSDFGADELEQRIVHHRRTWWEQADGCLDRLHVPTPQRPASRRRRRP